MDQEQIDDNVAHRLLGPFQEWSFDTVNTDLDTHSDETKDAPFANKTGADDTSSENSSNSGDSSEYMTPSATPTAGAGCGEASDSGQHIGAVQSRENAATIETGDHDGDVIMTDVNADHEVQEDEWNPTPEELLAIAFADEDTTEPEAAPIDEHQTRDQGGNWIATQDNARAGDAEAEGGDAGDNIHEHQEDARDGNQEIEIVEAQTNEHAIQQQQEDARLAAEGAANFGADTDPQPENPWGMSDAQLEQLRIDQDRYFGYIYDRDSAPRPFACVCGEASMDPTGFVNLTCPDNCVRCMDCLNANVKVGLESKKNYPPRCCIPIDFENVFYHLEPTLIDRWLDVRPEFEDIAPVYCSVKECSLYLPRDSFIEEGRWALCTKCNIKTCTACLCPKPQHDENSEACPERLDKMDKDLMKKQGWKSCPQCREMIERTEGCDHMICECGQEFCYRCGRSYEPPMPCNCHGQNQWAEDIQAEADPQRQRDILRRIADEEEDEANPRVGDDATLPLMMGDVGEEDDDEAEEDEEDDL